MTHVVAHDQLVGGVRELGHLLVLLIFGIVEELITSRLLHLCGARLLGKELTRMHVKLLLDLLDLFATKRRKLCRVLLIVLDPLLVVHLVGSEALSVRGFEVWLSRNFGC